MKLPEIIDLHMHSTASDGTDSPEMLMENVRNAGIELFALTDHDGIAGVEELRRIRKEQPKKAEGLLSLNGIEFSCRDQNGKYHILGYGYDETSEIMNRTVNIAHENRLMKVEQRLAFLKEDFGFTFEQKDIDALYRNHNPGKPHIANMMIKYGYAKTINEAIKDILNKKKIPNVYLKPEEAIDTILKSGGIPVLAHPSYGDGDQLITGDEMDERLKRLKGFGLQGVEAFYSGFTPKLNRELLDFADQYDFYVTAGSDYHGKNKLIDLGETNLDSVSEGPEKLHAFLEYVIESGKAY